MLFVSSSDSFSCLFLTLFLCHHPSLSLSLILPSLPPSLSFRWAGCCRLQVRGTPQPMKNECRRAPWLWWTSPYVGLSLFSIWLPPEKPPYTTHTQCTHTHKSGKRSGPNICLVEGRGCARVNTRSRGPFVCVRMCLCTHIITQMWFVFEIIFRGIHYSDMTLKEVQWKVDWRLVKWSETICRHLTREDKTLSRSHRVYMCVCLSKALCVCYLLCEQLWESGG